MESKFEETPIFPKKRGLKKMVRVAAMNDSGGEEMGRKGEVHPPADSWSWRKYGQKAIKGSPYPRGYYKCSSSEDCPVRKQVDRSQQDPSILVIRYSRNDHNHPRPHPPATYKNNCPMGSLDNIVNDAAIFSNSHVQSSEEFAGFVELAGELGWLYCSSTMDGELGTSLVGAMADYVEAFNCMNMPNIEREEDQQLFGDLEDLPESSLVFRWCQHPLA